MRRYVSSPIDTDRVNVAHEFDTTEELDESGDKLLVINNFGVEKASIDKDGNMTVANLSADNVDNSNASHYVVKAGTFTTAGGDATESIAAVGSLATDLAFVQLKAQGVTPRTILTAAAGIDEIVVTLSGDPSTDHVICWQLLRAM